MRGTAWPAWPREPIAASSVSREAGGCRLRKALIAVFRRLGIIVAVNDDLTLVEARPAAAWRSSAKTWWRWWLLPGAWMALIFALSAQPDFKFAPDAWKVEPISLTAHFLEYAVLAVLVWLAVSKTLPLAPWAMPIALAIAALYALSDELHQTVVPGRVADWRDWLSDVAGAAVALWAIRRGMARRRLDKDR